MPLFGSFTFGSATFSLTADGGASGATGATGPGGGGTGPGFGGSFERVGWLFQDAATGESYVLPINPLDCDIPAIDKNISYQATVAGGQVVYNGATQEPSMSFSGTILTEDHFRALEAWFQLQRQIKITDDLGREFWVYITDFSPTRERNTPFPWRMQYTANAVILDWGSN
jgi:hypothetical protein